jgi:serine/threonine protein kinase
MPGSVAHYQLLEPLGCGGLGELHRARDLRHGRTVALRLLAPTLNADIDARTAIVDAAARAAAASHPSLAAVYGCGEDAGVTFVASEFVQGQRLSALVGAAPLPARRALDLAAQIADGLAAAHAHDLVHGALSSSSVLITPRGAAKVLDTGFTAWTQAARTTAVDDFEGLGDLLFLMLAGRARRPGWPAEFRLPAVPASVRPVLERLTGMHASGRFASMASAAAALRSLTNEPFNTERREPVPPVQAAGARATPIVATVVVVAAAAAWWWLLR